jgi:hypothetical protein
MLQHTHAKVEVGAMAQAKFFDERTDQSEVKARIIQKYFYAWAKVIIPSAKHREKKIAYIDLYAGPGRYRDGAASTPLMILERAIEDPDLKQMLVTLFNDADKNHTSALQVEIDTYSPADASTPLLFSLARPFDGLKEELLKVFSRKKRLMKQIYEQHSVDTPFISRNYKDALLALENEGKITAEPTKRKKGTFADHVVVTFP